MLQPVPAYLVVLQGVIESSRHHVFAVRCDDGALWRDDGVVRTCDASSPPSEEQGAVLDDDIVVMSPGTLGVHLQERSLVAIGVRLAVYADELQIGRAHV